MNGILGYLNLNHSPLEREKLDTMLQAMTGKVMLRRRGIPGTLYLGLAKDGDSALSAHAWLRCGERILSGGPTHDQFTVIAHFAESLPSQGP